MTLVEDAEALALKQKAGEVKPGTQTSEWLATLMVIGSALIAAIGAVVDVLMQAKVFPEGSAGYVIVAALAAIVVVVRQYTVARASIKSAAHLAQGAAPPGN